MGWEGGHRQRRGGRAPCWSLHTAFDGELKCSPAAIALVKAPLRQKHRIAEATVAAQIARSRAERLVHERQYRHDGPRRPHPVHHDERRRSNPTVSRLRVRTLAARNAPPVRFQETDERAKPETRDELGASAFSEDLRLGRAGPHHHHQPRNQGGSRCLSGARAERILHGRSSLQKKYALWSALQSQVLFSRVTQNQGQMMLMMRVLGTLILPASGSSRVCAYIKPTF